MCGVSSGDTAFTGTQVPLCRIDGYYNLYSSTTERRELMTESQLQGGECVYKQHIPSPSARVFLEDMAAAICHSDNCEYRNDPCSHKRLALELLKAMLDYYSGVMDKKGYDDAANLLRSEL